MKKYLLLLLMLAVTFISSSTALYSADNITVKLGADSVLLVRDQNDNVVSTITSSGNVYFLGNVGIGITDTSKRLQVSGDIISDTTMQANIGDFNTIYVSSIVGTSPVYFQNNIDLGGNGISALGSLDVTYGITASTAVFSDAISATTLDTGQGAYELFAMDQDVQTTDAVTFSALTLNGDMTVPTAMIIKNSSYQLMAVNNIGQRNTSLGWRAGEVLESGAVANTLLGDTAGLVLTSGDYNTALGTYAGDSLTTGSHNTIVGASAGVYIDTGVRNTLVGYSSGLSIAGNDNTALGFCTLYDNTSSNSTAVGSWALRYNTGNTNTALGVYAGFNGVTGNYNLYLGALSGYENAGSNNVMVGTDAGHDSSGSGHVFIGSNAGYNESGDNKLYIENSQSASPLIWGDFSTDVVNINGNLGVGTTQPTEKLHITGGILSDTTVQATAGEFDSIYVSSIVGTSPVYFQNDIDLGGNAITDLNNLDVTYGITAATAVYSGAVTADKINTGYGDYELYAMDQDVQSGDAVTFAETIVSSISASGADGLFLLDDGNNGMFIEDGGNIGISTNEPAAKLDIIQSGAVAGLIVRNGTNPYMASTNGTVKVKLQVSNSDNTGIIGTEGGHNLNIITGNASKITVQSGGNVGIGTTSPTGLFQIGNGTMTVLSNGNVGINTTSPTAQLETTGDIKVNSITIGKGSGNVSNNTMFGVGVGTSVTTGQNNTYIGYNAAPKLDTEYSNTYLGSNTGSLATGGAVCTAVGAFALQDNQGNQNNAFGGSAGENTTTGYQNTFIGTSAGKNATTGRESVYVGVESGYDANAAYATAIGKESLKNNTAAYTVALGAFAALGNTDGEFNVALGYRSLYSNQSADKNTAVGYTSMENNIGSDNTAVGYQALFANTTGYNNTAVGSGAGAAAATGFGKTFVGFYAGQNATGNYNTAVGAEALKNATGAGNAAFGLDALKSCTSGADNTAIGVSAGSSLTTADSCVAVGRQALLLNNVPRTTGVGYKVLYNNQGVHNNAFGESSLYANTTGEGNNAFGWQVLTANQTGSRNNAFGSAVLNDTTSDDNSGFGDQALRWTTSGKQNTAVGSSAGYTNVTGKDNTYLGYKAGYLATASSNTMVGSGSGDSVTTGMPLTFIGYDSGSDVTDETNITLVGHNSVLGGHGNNSMVLGNTSQTVYIDGSALEVATTVQAVIVSADYYYGDGSNLTNLPSSLWTLSSGNVYRSSGNVGIGTTDPTQKLEVYNGNIKTNYGVIATTGVFSGAITATTLDTGQGAYELYAMDQNVQSGDVVTFAETVVSSISASGAAGLSLLDDGNNGMFIEDGGNVGLGEAAPETAFELTSSVPYITLHNSTNEDVNGRESRLNFKGQQSGGEETTLARIQASHDGTSDDQKGDLIFYTNDGADGDSPTEQMRIDSVGNVGIGTYNPLGNFHSFKDSIFGSGSALMRIVGSGTTLYIQPSSSTTPGSSADLFFADWYNANPKLVIKAGGNVGIGTNDPSEILHVAGDILSDTTIQAMVGDFTDVYVSTIYTKSPLYINAGTDDVIFSGTGNLGIGTTDPLRKLDVNGNVEADYYYGDGSTLSNLPTGLWTEDSGNIYRSSGNVGIAKTNPTEKLMIGDATRITVSSISYSLIGTLNADSADNTRIVMSGHARPTYGGSMEYITAENGIVPDHIFVKGTTELMRIEGSSGNVGIGITAPSTNLQVKTTYYQGVKFAMHIQNPSANDSNGDSVGLLFAVESNNTFGKGGLVYERTANYGMGKFHFLQETNATATNPTLSDSVMTITNDGNVGIGTTEPVEKLEVIGDIASSTTIYAPIGDFTDVYVSTVYSKSPLQFAIDGTNRMTLNNDGNVGIDITNPNALLSLGGSVGDTKLAMFDTGGVASYGLGIQAYQFRLHLSGSEGRFSFLSASAGTELLTIKGTGNVGIGTATPAEIVHIKGNTDTPAILIEPNNWADVGDYGEVRFGDANHYIRGEFTNGMTYYDGNKHVFLGSNVGIGTTENTAPLCFGDSVANSKILLWGNATTGYGMGIQSSQYRLHVANSSGRFSFLSASDGNELLTVKGTGNVGIGTTNPIEMLHVHNTNGEAVARVSSGSNGNALMELSAPSASYQSSLIFKTLDTSFWQLRHHTDGKLKIYSYTLADDVMTFTHGGNVGIGTTNPVEKLQVQGNVRMTGESLYAPGLASGDGINLIYNSGFIQPYSSSKRYKENIELFEDDFYKLLEIEPKIYTRKNDPKKKKEIGYIAEEVDEAGLNYLVFYDEKGRPESINNSKFVMYTNEIVKDNVESLKEQQEEIENLNKEILLLKEESKKELEELRKEIEILKVKVNKVNTE